MDLTAIDRMLFSEDPAERREAATRVADLEAPQAFDRLERLLRDPNSAVKDAALNTILMLGSREAVQRMASLLEEEDPGVRNAAIDILRRIGDEGLDILNALTLAPSDNVRLFVVDILGSIGNRDSVACLIESLHDANPNVRNAAVVSLGLIGDERAFEHLTRMINDEEWIRFAVIEALARIPHAGALSFLMNELERRADDEVTVCAILETLGQLRSPSIVPYLMRMIDGAGEYVQLSIVQTVMEVLSFDEIAALEESDRKAIVLILERNLPEADETRGGKALELLARIGDEQSGACIVNLARITDPIAQGERWDEIREALASLGHRRSMVALLDEGDDKLRILGAEVLGHIGTAQEARAIAARIPDSQGHVRRAFTLSLSHLCDPGTRDTLLQLMHDADGHVASYAIAALGGMGEPDAIDAIEPFLAHRYGDVRHAALEAIASLGTKRAEDTFRRLLAETDEQLRILGVNGLQRIGSPLLEQVVKGLFRDASPEVRLSAVRVAWERRMDLELDCLEALLEDAREEIRHLATDIVGLKRIEALRPHLLEALSGGDMWLASHAIEALGHFRDETARDQLLSILKHGPDFLRIVAAKTLGTWDDPALAEEIEIHLEDENLDVARAVSQAVDRLRGEGF